MYEITMNQVLLKDTKKEFTTFAGVYQGLVTRSCLDVELFLIITNILKSSTISQL